MHRALASLCLIALAACGKVSETAAEKMIESQINKDGGQASVDLNDGGMRISSVDASGKTSHVEMGTAKISEADLGLPFYPGTQPREGETTRMTTPEGSMVTVILHSDDAPDKVAAFYRDKLKMQAQGKQFTDMRSDDTHAMTLTDDGRKQVTQVTVAKNDDKGSDIQIMAHRGTAK